MTHINQILATLFLMVMVLLPPISALPRDAELSIDFTYHQPSGNITNEYINNTYINQTLELNSTQFETGEPATIKTSWLTSFIEGISKWVNYYTKSEIDNRYSNNTGDQDLSNYYNKTSNLNAVGYNVTADYYYGNASFMTGIPSPDLSAYFTLDQTTSQTISNGAPVFSKGLKVNADNEKIIMGAGNDSEEYFDGSNQIHKTAG